MRPSVTGRQENLAKVLASVFQEKLQRMSRMRNPSRCRRATLRDGSMPRRPWVRVRRWGSWSHTCGVQCRWVDGARGVHDAVPNAAVGHGMNGVHGVHSTRAQRASSRRANSRAVARARARPIDGGEVKGAVRRAAVAGVAVAVAVAMAGCGARVGHAEG